MSSMPKATAVLRSFTTCQPLRLKSVSVRHRQLRSGIDWFSYGALQAAMLKESHCGSFSKQSCKAHPGSSRIHSMISFRSTSSSLPQLQTFLFLHEHNDRGFFHHDLHSEGACPDLGKQSSESPAFRLTQPWNSKFSERTRLPTSTL